MIPTGVQPLCDLSDATDTRAQINALRRVKNELTGHRSRKVEYIQNGVIPAVTKTLVSGTASTLEDAEDVELVTVQAATVLCVIAHGEMDGFPQFDG